VRAAGHVRPIPAAITDVRFIPICLPVLDHGAEFIERASKLVLASTQCAPGRFPSVAGSMDDCRSGLEGLGV